MHGARSDALGKHMDLMRAEKASLAAELTQTRAECADLRSEIEHLQGRCMAAEDSTDAISKVSTETIITHHAVPRQILRWLAGSSGIGKLRPAWDTARIYRRHMI